MAIMGGKQIAATVSAAMLIFSCFRGFLFLSCSSGCLAGLLACLNQRSADYGFHTIDRFPRAGMHYKIAYMELGSRVCTDIFNRFWDISEV